VDVSIFDVSGHLVRRLDSGTLKAGVHELMWDGRDASGQPAGAGIYMVRVNTAGKQAVKRLVLVK
jgi:flagellar basal-body rod modification protein FlgD